MGAATIVTLIGVAIAVAAIAVYLTVIAVILYRVSFNVGTVLIGVRSIAHQTEPVGTVVEAIVDDVETMESALAGVLGPELLPPARRPRRRLTART